MPEYIDQNCPLCGRPAKYCLANHKMIKYFRCEYCADFQISDRGEDLLTNVTEQWRKSASEESRNSEYDNVLIIKMVDASRLKPGESPYPVWSFCDRAKIPQCR